MKQIIQDLKNGNTVLEDVPVPVVRRGQVLIKTTRSLVSLGTEKMLVEFGKAGLVEKARQQPDRVKQVLEKIKTDGLIPTLEAVFNKLNQPLPLGYCNAGVIIEVGEGVTAFKVGDRVASNGNHAEFVCIPENLAAKIPGNVTDEEAAFTVIGSIALQGIRLLNPTFGETVVVTGLGLIGLITAELLLANGCRVIGIDPDEEKILIAKESGITVINPGTGENPVSAVMELTGNRGADGVIITASSKSDEIIHQAAEMSRKRGRIILVGVIGLHLRRADFYQKELTFQVSCSYGPGRYDENYETKGQDYPAGYVRWTEKRNFEAVLHAISCGNLHVKRFITGRYPLEDYLGIYGEMGKKGEIASILEYPENPPKSSSVEISGNNIKPSGVIAGIIGAGNFTSSMIIPMMKKAGTPVKSVASAKGLSAKILARKAGAAIATSEYHDILNDPEISLAVISTRHDLHAKMVAEALNAGKNVFVEKPLCLTHDELENIIRIYRNVGEKLSLMLTVGFNRRFAPMAVRLKDALGTEPVNIVATMNAGFIPPEVWVHDLATGGGRIIGEACHFIDLCTFFTGSRVISVYMNALGVNPAMNCDNASIVLKYENGSNSVINYFANGSKSYSKERIEVYSQERTFIIDNWRSFKAYGAKGVRNISSSQDKGHRNQFAMLNDKLLKGGQPLIPFGEIVNTTRATLAAVQSMKEGRKIEL